MHDPHGLVFEIDASEFATAVRLYEQRAERIDRLLGPIAQELAATVSDVFEAEGPDWEPLAESTLEQRRGSDAKILQDTGQLVGSVLTRYSLNYAEAYSPVEYAKFHATGTGRMPQRNPFDPGPFERALLDRVEDMILDELLR